MAIPQVTYPADMTKALEGQIYDVGTDAYVRSLTDAANATFFGRAATQDGLADGQFKHPDGAAQPFAGITTRTHYRDPSDLPAATLEGTAATDTSNILSKGRVWVITETQVTSLANPIYFRHANAGAGPEGVGRFRTDDDGASGDVTQVTTGARWITTNGAAGELAVLEIDLP